MSNLEASDGQIKHITDQYQAAVDECNLLFSALSLRTTDEMWRETSGIYAGIGSCYITKKKSEGHLLGPARDTIIQLREKRNAEHGGTSGNCPCPYHREGEGCILGGFKSPLCAGAIDNPVELVWRFDLNPNELERDIRGGLERILYGGYNPDSPSDPIDPTKNDGFVAEFVEDIRKIRESIEKYPILHPDEVAEVV